ncbi:MAG: hypothetical protein DSY76_00485, partial [Bacteroidetes bacterium]
MNERVKNIISVALFSIVNIHLLFAQNLHVATNGSDASGNGSINNPYATITKAAKYIKAGDTVFVHQGVYHNE